ncbi:hypothetical protein Dtox_1616 [Desulfofarcimen acetoxidans DSM 771]|uniref:Uncharacterized protein n=1 Tax=Desulfofarcimen acetoxidans (strain ATCC 49208 / DSM 771 / KCTC 5769 / VKM B-1644 / 5575) TaxID=485916 RepID=C8VWC2_DESAS|nr:hypothetical protein Dtox_1616 [Desulfofarcimen acetoxidans DSM 771]
MRFMKIYKYIVITDITDMSVALKNVYLLNREKVARK